MNFMIFHALGILSSQVTFIFFNMVKTPTRNIKHGLAGNSYAFNFFWEGMRLEEHPLH